MINSREWLDTRKNLLDQVKAQVKIRLGPLPANLRRYAKDLDGDFRSRWRASDVDELRVAVDRARLVLSADFHAYSQSQRAHIRILRDLVGTRPVVLALECLSPSQEAIFEKYRAGKLTEAELSAALSWDKNWGFPWEGYRRLFELARDRNFIVKGLFSSESSLSRRDAWTARRISEFQRLYPEHLVFVVIGEWHLAANHLPRQLKTDFRSGGEGLILFQDVEPLYFKLASKGLERATDVLRASGNRFCLMVSPPWMKWQSYLMFLEHAYDRELQEDLSIDYSDHVASLISLLENDLRVQTKKSKIQVYCPNSKTSLARIRLELPAREERALMFLLERDHSFFLPQKSWLYLSRPTINHASALAGQFVHAQLCRRERTLWNMPNDFLPLIWIEAVGFFFSKWVNPQRKAETLESIRIQLAGQDPLDGGRKALLLALDHRLSEVLWSQTGRIRKLKYRPREVGAYLDAARILGEMLGERLFQKVKSRTISLRELMAYLKVSVDSTSASDMNKNLGFAKFYWKLVREIEQDKSL